LLAAVDKNFHMKTIKNYSISLCLVVALVATAFTQDDKNKQVDFKVRGVCEMCKERIEAAAMIKGVKLVKWDAKAQSAKVYFNSTKTSEEAIQKAIAQVGHDTEKIQATDSAYQTLPACCAYRDGVDVH
jgi:copper chaperone CopZ